MPDMFAPKLSAKVLQPFLSFKGGYQKNIREFLKLGNQLGCSPWRTWQAFKKAVKAQSEFEKELHQIGKKALGFGRENQIPVIVVLSHPYIVYSSLLSAGIPETIQEKGAIALPTDCYPLQGLAPVLDNIYWGYGHRLLNVAYEVRRQPGVYPLWLSVYSCGPDSFLIHFFQYLSSGKPYTVLESDAYTGQAGFKTRIEAFLYGIKNYQEKEMPLTSLFHFEFEEEKIPQQIEKKLLFPWMGEGTRTLVSCVKALGVKAEALPSPDEEALAMARQYTSGKECLPMACVLGSLLQYLQTQTEKLICFMPKAMGPCRLGQYHLLMRIILEKLQLQEKVEILSPTSETGYRFQEKIGKAMVAKTWSAIILTDLLKKALLEIRPDEKILGMTEKVFENYLKELEETILQSPNDWSGKKNLWGMKELAQKAAEEFREIPCQKEKKPKVLITGEIYVRLVDSANCFVIKELEALGVKTELASTREWFNYTLFLRRKGWTLIPQKKWRVYLTWLHQKRIESTLYQIFARALDWPKDHSIDEILDAAKPYLSKLRPLGEAALTIGLPLLLWQKKEIDGVVLVGPFECMPTRIGETQLSLISQQTGLPVLTLSFNGEPLEKDLLESFIWDLKKATNR